MILRNKKTIKYVVPKQKRTKAKKSSLEKHPNNLLLHLEEFVPVLTTIQELPSDTIDLTSGVLSILSDTEWAKFEKSLDELVELM